MELRLESNTFKFRISVSSSSSSIYIIYYLFTYSKIPRFQVVLIGAGVCVLFAE
jgi:hypothetical protein